MKIILIATVFLFASIIGYSQCTPHAPTGNPGVTPGPDSVACIVRGVPYSTTMYIENYGTIGTPPFSATVDSARIDSLVNFPCGLTWQADKLLYHTGETGCIVVSGTATDSVGQYPLKIYMTITATALGQQQTFSGELTSIVAQISQLPIAVPIGNLEYYSRVIESGNPCPAIDTSGSATNLTASCAPIIDDVEVSISGSTVVCAGGTTTLTATPINANGTVTYDWNTGATTASITVSPTTTSLYSVTVTDTAGTAITSKTVTVNNPPTALFTVTDTAAGDSALVITLTNASSLATTATWNFGDGSTSLVYTPPQHTYTENDTYTVTLIVTNNCGADTFTRDIVVSNIGVFIKPVKYDLTFDMSPNPSKGSVALSFSAENKEYSLKIYDLSGKNVFEEKIAATSGTVHKQLDLSGLPKGIYTLHLSSGNSLGVKKLQLN